jgi:hypothetical protein
LSRLKGKGQETNGINTKPNGKSLTPIKKMEIKEKKVKRDELEVLPPIRNERAENDKKLDEITNMMNKLLEEN